MYRITVAIIFAVFLAILCVGVSHAGGWFHGAGRGPTPGQSTGPGTLPALTCAANCDLQFVADDWSGSGNWAARSGGWTATLTGAPVISSSSVFSGRKYISGWTNTDFFKMAANSAHTPNGSSTITYEWVFDKLPLAGGFAAFGGNIFLGNAGGVFLYVTTGNRFDLEIANTLANPFIGGLSGGSDYVTDKPVLLTVTFEMSPQRVRLYVNGVQLTSGVFPVLGTSSGTYIAQDCAFGIGARWNCNTTVAGDALGTIRIMEFVRHQVALDAATIAARAAPFNGLKGY